MGSTPAADDQRFRDEWVVRLLPALPDVDPARIERWRMESRPYLSQCLVDEAGVEFDVFARALQDRFRIDAAEPRAEDVPPGALSIVPERLCRTHHLLPRSVDARSVGLFMANPLDEEAQTEVRWVAGREVEPTFCLPGRMEKLITQLLSPDAVIYDLLRAVPEAGSVEVLGLDRKDPEQAGAEDAEKRAERAPVVRLANAIIADAVGRGASDVHLEHEDGITQVRFRIDGKLRRVLTLPEYVGRGPLVARLKIMAGMDIADRLRPQDGRIRLRIDGDDVGLRVSTLPSRAGEKVVLRILRDESATVHLDALGFRGEVHGRMERMIQRAEGMILVTGPTGSGKTTTLYAALNRRRTEDVNIVTIEDPVEYSLEGITQVQVKEAQGLTFPAVLRSVLRQDPDVVMVGEIRDAETADIATQAALTGHLVFSTLHTNDAVSTVTRLTDMGVERFKLAAGLLAVTAQRLVRRLCDRCSRTETPEGIPEEARRAAQRIGTEPRFRRAEGCEGCDYTGYRGRLALVEYLEITPAVRDGVARGEDAGELRRQALADGALHPLVDDAVWHLATGATTYEEVAPHLEGRDLTEVGEAGASPEAVSDAPRDADGLAGRRILLALPDEDQRSVIGQVLEAQGAMVAEADRGATALAVAASGNPDLLVVDRSVADPGPVELLRGIREILGRRDLPVLLTVPESTEGWARELLEDGATDYLLTPVDPERAAARVRGILERRTRWSSQARVAEAPPPLDEGARLAALRESELLGSGPEERFDHITRTARRLFDVPVAMFNLVDEEGVVIKAADGIDTGVIPRDEAFCAHTILGEDVLVVSDLALDPRFSDYPLVAEEQGARFYAGYPVTEPGAGRVIGTLCIIDYEPRTLEAEDVEALRDLGRMVERELTG